MNHLLLWKDITLFWGSNPRAIAHHQHPMIQLVIAESSSFLSKAPNGDWVPKSGLLIGANQAHECDAQNLSILSLGIDPESSFGEWIHARFLQVYPVVDYPFPGLEPLDFSTLNPIFEQKAWKKLREILERAVAFQPTPNREIDDRIKAVNTFIVRNLESPLATARLMEVAHLSESRLLHLFKDQMGLPIRNYILWCRLQRAMKFFLAGNNLTEAAHRAGFADQAHFTRTCVRMMGLPPSTILKNSKIVQVSFPQ